MTTVCSAAETFTVTPTSVVSFGAEGGDTFGVEKLEPREVVVLFRPLGESCTLRFPLTIGESVILRSGIGDKSPQLCEAALLSINDGKAHFSAQCSPYIPTDFAPKCPAEPASAKLNPDD